MCVSKHRRLEAITTAWSARLPNYDLLWPSLSERASVAVVFVCVQWRVAIRNTI